MLAATSAPSFFSSFSDNGFSCLTFLATSIILPKSRLNASEAFGTHINNEKIINNFNLMTRRPSYLWISCLENAVQTLSLIPTFLQILLRFPA